MKEPEVLVTMKVPNYLDITYTNIDLYIFALQ